MISNTCRPLLPICPYITYMYTKYFQAKYLDGGENIEKHIFMVLQDVPVDFGLRAEEYKSMLQDHLIGNMAGQIYLR